MSKQLAQEVANRLRAGALVVIVQEADEQLALASVAAGAESCGQITSMSGAAPEATEKLEGLASGTGVLVLSDFLSIYGSNALTVRLIREVALQQRDEGERFSRLIMIESPTTEIPQLLRGDVEVVTPALPSVAELTEELELFTEAQEIKLSGNGEARYAIAGAVAGLARHEASRLFAMCYVEREDLDPGWLRKAKASKVADRLAGALTFENELSADVGGLDNLKEWLSARRAAFGSVKAKEFGLPEPKGMLLLGIPGCGKSLTAKTVAREWGLPLLRLDAGKLFGSLVGQSEAQTRAAIEAAEACAPCVLWVDEIEKGLAGSSGSGSGDSGTGQRVFGTLLTWLQEKEAPVFVVATANKISNLPPELLRKGRFDEIFFVGLPTLSERVEITSIHLARRKKKLTKAEVKRIAEAAADFSGAEIEQALIEGMFTAYSNGRDLTCADVLSAIEATTPISRTMSNEIEALKKWAEGRARIASNPTTNTTKGRARRRGPQLKKG